MNAERALAALRKAGRPNTIAIYARHGVKGPCWGVSYADVRALTKQIGMNHDVALALWRSGVHDARVLATMVADASIARRDTIDTWLAACDNYILTDAVSAVAAAMPAALELARAWITSPREWTSAAGWTVLAVLATKGRLAADDVTGLLDRIEQTIHTEPNRTRYAMNNVLIGLGGYVPGLRARALEVARAIGPVEVDHGQTGCKTPDAAAYIAKMDARQKSRRSAAAAKRTRVTASGNRTKPRPGASRGR